MLPITLWSQEASRDHACHASQPLCVFFRHVSWILSKTAERVCSQEQRLQRGIGSRSCALKPMSLDALKSILVSQVDKQFFYAPRAIDE